MSSIFTIEEVTGKNIEDLCVVCVPEKQREHPDWIKGIEEKKAWAREMIKRYGSFAKVVYIENTPAGMIQYRPLPGEGIVEIDCIYVREPRFWRIGAGSKLLSTLIEEMKRPIWWFGNTLGKGLIVHTFPGEKEGQISARDFFIRRGFRPVGDDPDFLFFPLKEGFVYKPREPENRNYQSQKEDKGKVLIFCGPNRCPVAFPIFLKKMEEYIKEVNKDVPIIYIDISTHPDFVQKRNARYGDCVVNGRLIRNFVLDKNGFQDDVRRALEDR